MNWLLAHAYVAFLSVALLIAVTTGIALHDSSQSETTRAGWGRVGGFSLSNQPTNTVNKNAMEPQTFITEPSPEAYAVIPIRSTLEQTSEALLDEWQSLLTQLTEPDVPAAPSQPSTDAYSFIPKGLVSTVAPVEQKTPLQQELYDYGNRVGGYIRDFDNNHTNMIPILKDAYAARGNPDKHAAAEKIGDDYRKLGADLEAIGEIPPAIAKMHVAIALSYKTAGERMITKLRAESDEDFLAAMHAYNASVLEFTNNFVALATYLSAAGVKFGTTDAGSVFTFTQM